MQVTSYEFSENYFLVRFVLSHSRCSEVIKAKLPRPAKRRSIKLSMSDHQTTTSSQAPIGSTLPTRVYLTTSIVHHDWHTWSRRKKQIRSVQNNSNRRIKWWMAAADFDWLVLETVLRVVDLADIATTILKRSACSAASEVAQCIGTLTSIRAPIETFAQVICDRRTMQEVAVRTSDLRALTSRDYYSPPKSSFPVATFFTHFVTIRVQLSSVTI